MAPALRPPSCPRPRTTSAWSWPLWRQQCEHEAIETDIVAYSAAGCRRWAPWRRLAREHHDIKRIAEAAAAQRGAALGLPAADGGCPAGEAPPQPGAAQKVFQDLLYLMDWMEEMKVPADAGGQRWSGPCWGWRWAGSLSCSARS